MVKLKYPIIKEAELRKILSSYKIDKNHAFFNYFGNDGAIETACDIAFQAMTQKEGNNFNYRTCRERIAIYSPMSTGKTEFARRFSKLMCLPSSEIDGASFKSIDNMVKKILNDWSSNTHVQKYTKFFNIEDNFKEDNLEIPPMIITIDEFHRISKKNQDLMLKMFEKNDGIVTIKEKTYDFKNVCFIILTNNSGNIGRALKSRFLEISLQRPSFEDSINILLSVNENISYEDASTVVKLCPVIRQSISFMQRADSTKNRMNFTMKEAIEETRKRLKIYSCGINERALKILEILNSTDGLSKKNLISSMDDMSEAEFEEEIIPQLLSPIGKPPAIKVDSKHRITGYGISLINDCKRECIESKINEKINIAV